jgi:hypothetical protein
MYSLLQIVVYTIKTLKKNSNNNYDSIDESQLLFICCLNTIESQQEISTTKEINYLLNLPNRKTSHDFIYIPWYSLLPWANEQEKNQNVQNGQKMIPMSIMKVS